jgi:4'-phosphopantetheinyl transferase
MPSSVIPLPSGHSAALWRARLDVSPEACHRLAALLADDEQAHAGRLGLADVRRRFVAARAALRSILAEYLGVAPRDVPLAASPAGKPHVVDRPDLQFNLSHSADLLVCAVASQPVGVDVERIRPHDDVMAIARRFFAPEECDALERLPAHRRVDAFYACWTRKEAYLKALGLGVGESLRQFAVSVDPAAPAILASSLPGDDAARWRVSTIALPPEFAGALVTAAACVDVIDREWRWPDA